MEKVKMKNWILMITASLGLAACGDYIPQTVFEIETVNGEVIKLSCPVIDQGRSTLTYLIDHECRVLK